MIGRRDVGVMMKKYAWMLLRLLLSLGLVGWVLAKIDWTLLAAVVQQLHYGWLMVALLLFNVSRLIAAQRLYWFFCAVGLRISTELNLKLYYLGLWYNVLLPGGITGDGYKVYWLRKYYPVSAWDLAHATFFDRISGLFALLLLLLLALRQAVVMTPGFQMLLVVAMLAMPALAYVLHYVLGRRFLSLWVQSSLLAILMQLFQVFTVGCLLWSLREFAHLDRYIVVFLLSSMVAVLPLTIGGLGAREFTFVYLQPWLGYDLQTGVVLSMLFYLLGLVSAMLGIFFQDLQPDYRLQQDDDLIIDTE